MILAYWCVLIAGLMPVLTVGIAKWGARGFDNGEPRAWMDKQQGWRRRADYAHRNHFEAFPFFAAAVIISAGHASLDMLNAHAIAFIIVRVIYTALYLANRPSLRSVAWVIGYLIVIGIFIMPVMHRA